MTTLPDNELLGFYASFNMGEKDQELVKQYLWGDTGLKNKLKSIKWSTYGKDFHLILFQIYVRPIPEMREALKEIESYRKKEKSIGIPIIIDDSNFFNLKESDRQVFFKNNILIKLDLLKDKIKRNKLDLDLSRLKSDVESFLNNSKQ